MQTIDLSSYEPVAATDLDAVQIANGLGLVQTRYNNLVSDLSGGATGKVLYGNSTTLSWAYPPGYELAYVEFTSDVSVTATSSGTANSVVSAGAVTYDGTAVWIEFWSVSCSKGTSQLNLELYDGTSSLGYLAIPQQAQGGPICGRRKVTPSAGSHTYNVKAYVDAGTGTVFAGAGGSAATKTPGFIRITKA